MADLELSIHSLTNTKRTNSLKAITTFERISKVSSCNCRGSSPILSFIKTCITSKLSTV